MYNLCLYNFRQSSWVFWVTDLMCNIYLAGDCRIGAWGQVTCFTAFKIVRVTGMPSRSNSPFIHFLMSEDKMKSILVENNSLTSQPIAISTCMCGWTRAGKYIMNRINQGSTSRGNQKKGLLYSGSHPLQYHSPRYKLNPVHLKILKTCFCE